jgi:Leucine-rich repeat (LRR) protein
MGFYFCKFLEKIPDVSGIPNLQSLNLVDCENLVDVHCSVGFLNNLVELCVVCCNNLRSFPESLMLRSLKFCRVFDSLSLIKFPEIGCQMEYLEKIYINDCGIEKLPSSIGCFVRVKNLNLSGCKNLMNLPDSIHQLQHLEVLSLNSCSSLKELPSSIGCLGRIEQLNLHGCTNLTNLPDSIHQLKHLKFLGLSDCTRIKELPSSFGYMGRIERLDLNNCTNLMNLPESIYQLKHLEYLSLRNCSKVKFLKKVEDNKQSIPSIVSLEKSAISSRTKSLQLLPSTNTSDFSDDSSSTAYSKLQELNLGDCELSYSNFFRMLDCGTMLYELNLSGSDIVTLSRCIESFVGLRFLYLNECKQLREILGLPPNVEKVKASGCVSLEIFLERSRRSQLFNTEDPTELVGVGTLIPAQQSLRELDLSGSAIVSLPTWFNKFVKLEELSLSNCKQLRESLRLPPNVRYVFAQECLSLEIFLVEPQRSKLFNTWDPPDPLRVGLVSPALQPLEQMFQLECPFNSLENLNLSGSAIVSLPTLLNKFVRLRSLDLKRCKQLREVPELPRNIKYVWLGGCTSLERLPFNNIYDLPKLNEIDFSDCPEHIGNVVHHHLFSEVFSLSPSLSLSHIYRCAC